MQRRAHAKAAELGISFAEYVRRVMAQDLGEAKPKADISIIFDLINEGARTDIARDKDKIIGEAVWKEYLRKTGRKPAASAQVSIFVDIIVLVRDRWWPATIEQLAGKGNPSHDRRLRDHRSCRGRNVAPSEQPTSSPGVPKLSGRRMRRGAVRVEMVTPRIWRLRGQSANDSRTRTFSLVDRTSFAVMERLGVTRVASFDRDFAIYRYGRNRDKAFEVLR